MAEPESKKVKVDGTTKEAIKVSQCITAISLQEARDYVPWCRKSFLCCDKWVSGTHPDYMCLSFILLEVLMSHQAGV